MQHHKFFAAIALALLSLKPFAILLSQDALDVICVRFMAVGEELKRFERHWPGLLAKQCPEVDWKGSMGFRVPVTASERGVNRPFSRWCRSGSAGDQPCAATSVPLGSGTPAQRAPYSASAQQAVPQLRDVAISATTEADRPVCGADTQRQNYLISRL